MNQSVADKQQLQDAFELFNQVSEQLTGSYQVLQQQVASLTRVAVKRAYVDRGYRGHGIEREGLDITLSHTRGIASPTIRREMRRRNAIEPVIGHMKDDGLLERNHLAGPDGDAINVILCAAGHNMRLLARWLRLLVLMILAKILRGAGNHPDHQTPTITA